MRWPFEFAIKSSYLSLFYRGHVDVADFGRGNRPSQMNIRTHHKFRKNLANTNSITVTEILSLS